jgi:hypothetical protein
MVEGKTKYYDKEPELYPSRHLELKLRLIDRTDFLYIEDMKYFTAKYTRLG